MTYLINKEDIKNILENSNFMLGVNKGFHDSPLPEFAVKNYSNPETFKNNKKKDDLAIAQDLGLRMGSQAISKATLGGLTYGAIKYGQHEYFPDLDQDSDAALLTAAIPALAAAWAGSDLINKKIPTMHRKIVGKKSIYKDPNG